MLRLIHLIVVISKYSFIFLLIKLRLYRKPSPQLIRNFFEEAGGSFIKFGQILSLRIDVLPKDYSLELLDLLDNVKPFSFNDVVGIFRNELGAHPNEIFSSFEVNPIASASFGQVHVAYLNGEKVAVKIMRPGVENDVAIDFIVIRLIAIIVDQFVKLDAIPWRDSAKEFERWTRLELDYRNEAENNDKLYKSKRSSAVFIPKVYFHFSTQKVLVQEFVEGIPLSKVMKALKSGETNAEKKVVSINFENR